MGEIQEKSLRDLKCGEAGVVKKVNVTGALKRRIMDMGITPGIEIKLRKVAPLGDPLEVVVRGYELSIRKSEAEFILLK